MANSSKANIVNFLQMQKIFIKILHGWKISLLTYKIFTILLYGRYTPFVFTAKNVAKTDNSKGFELHLRTEMGFPPN